MFPLYYRFFMFPLLIAAHFMALRNHRSFRTGAAECLQTQQLTQYQFVPVRFEPIRGNCRRC